MVDEKKTAVVGNPKAVFFKQILGILTKKTEEMEYEIELNKEIIKILNKKIEKNAETISLNS